MKEQNNSIKITGIIVASILVMFLITAGMVFSFTERKVISSQGEAVVTVMPDVVSINFNVETNGSTAKIAKDANAEIVTKVVDALMELGFERSEIETMNLNIYEDYQWTEKGGRESIGFKATHNIRVKFDAVDQPELGPIVDAGVDSGALLQYINFELSPELESEYKARALELAGADAKLKATAMVTGVGGKLGKLVSVSESNFGYMPWRAYGAEMMTMDSVGAKVNNFDESTSIQIGEREITGTINVVYEIK